MNPFVRTPSFTASHPDMGTQHLHSDSSPVAKVTRVKASRPVLHLPASSQGVTRRSWPFLNSLDSLDSLESLSLLNR